MTEESQNSSTQSSSTQSSSTQSSSTQQEKSPQDKARAKSPKPVASDRSNTDHEIDSSSSGESGTVATLDREDGPVEALLDDERDADRAAQLADRPADPGKSPDDHAPDRPLFWSVMAIFAGGLMLRLWNLGERALHHDESLDAWWSSRFVDGTYDGYDPVFHGPLRFYITGFFYTIFGESPATARLFAALCGALLVAVPWFMRHHLGRAGTIASALFLALSPSMLYFSRFGREDAQIMFLSGVMIALAAMFNHRPRGWMPPVFGLALVSSFAIKESTYLWVGIVGSFGVVVLAVQYERIASARRRKARATSNGVQDELDVAPPERPRSIFDFEVAFPLVAIMGLTFAVIAGHRHWLPGGVFLMIGIWAAGLMAAMLFQFWVSGGSNDRALGFALGMGGAFSMSFGLLVMWLLRPEKDAPEVFSERWMPGNWAFMLGLVLMFALNVVLYLHVSNRGAVNRVYRPTTFSLPVPTAAVLGYAAFRFQPFSRVPTDEFFPKGVLFVAGMVAAAVFVTAGLRWIAESGESEGIFAASIAQRLREAGSVSWLFATGLFLFCWVLFFTVLFIYPHDWFSGVSEAIGYWDSQQDVNRGGQPWYYYFVTIPAYEWVFMLLAIPGTMRAWRQRTFLQGLLLWSTALSFVLFSYAGERMPWLVVHPLLPILFLAGLGVQELWENRTTAMVLGLSSVLALGFAFTTFTSLRASFVTDTDGRELFVQAGQATEHVTALMDEIERLDQISRAEFDRPLRLALGADDAWPWAYYLKDYEYTTWDGGQTPEVPADMDVLIVNNYIGNRGDFFNPEFEMPNHTPHRFALRVWWVPANKADADGNFTASVSYFDTKDDNLLPTRAIEWLNWTVTKDGSWKYTTGGGCGSVDQWFMVSNELQAAAERTQGYSQTPELPLLPCASDDMSYSQPMVNCMLDQGFSNVGLHQSINELNAIVQQRIAEQTEQGLEVTGEICDKF